MIPRHFISPLLLLLPLLALFSTNVSGTNPFRKLKLGSSSPKDTTDTRSQSGSQDPSSRRHGRFTLGKKPQLPTEPIVVIRRLEFWIRNEGKSALLAVEVKGQLGGIQPPYMVEQRPKEEVNSPEKLNSNGVMNREKLLQYNAKMIQEELVNARQIMYDARGNYKPENCYVAGIQQTLDSMIDLLDSDKNPLGVEPYKTACLRYEPLANFLRYSATEYPINNFNFRSENPETIEVLDPRDCAKKSKCHNQKIGFSGDGRLGLTPPVVYRVCACSTLKG